MCCKINLSNLKRKARFNEKKKEPIIKWTDSNRKNVESYTK